MRFIDLDSGELRKQMTASPVVAEGPNKRGLPRKYAIQFVRDAEVIELEDVDEDTAAVVILGFKAPAGYDSVAYVLGPFTAVKSGSVEDGDVTYTFTIEFLNAQLDQLLAGNLDDVTLRPEIKWTSLNENGETLAFDWVVQNNVNRGGESVSSYPVTAQTVRLPAVSRLTGGILATDLDAQLLSGYPNGSTFEVITFDSVLAGRVGSRWEKDNTRSETVTNVGEGVIICTDATKIFRV
jgi:hypothetical protein